MINEELFSKDCTMTREQRELFSEAWECADNCDTCWYLITDQAHDELGDDVITDKLRVHLASGHITTSEES